MSFHEVLFPTNISYGSSGGPGFSTSIVGGMDSGTEERVARWGAARRRYNARYGIKAFSDLSTLLSFYIARQGPASGFRYKDFLDYTTASDHRSAPAFGDVDIGVGNASATTFQLIKKYVSGVITRTRNITKPVTGTTVVGLNGVNQASGWSVNTTTGIVTFSSAPGNGVVVSAGCEFDTPVRFGAELDTALDLTIDSFETGGVDDIPIVEVNDDGTEIQDEYFYGGSKSHGNVAANFSISVGDGRVQTFTPTVGGVKLTLPSTTSLAAGGPYFALYNQSASNTVEVRDVDGNTVKVIAVSSGTVIWLGENASLVKIWLAIP